LGQGHASLFGFTEHLSCERWLFGGAEGRNGLGLVLLDGVLVIGFEPWLLVLLLELPQVVPFDPWPWPIGLFRLVLEDLGESLLASLVFLLDLVHRVIFVIAVSDFLELFFL